MSKQGVIEVTGTITESLANSLFRVDLEHGTNIICQLSGKMRQNYIRVIPGDQVTIELSPYDLTRGRISARLSGNKKTETENKKKKGKK